MNISQYSHRLITTIIISRNLKDTRSKLQYLGWIYLMVKPVTRLSIPMSISRLNFITKLIFIHLSKPMISLAKLANHIMDNNVYIPLHITLVTSLSTVDLTPNFSESNYIYPYYKWYKLCSDCTNSYVVLRIII